MQADSRKLSYIVAFVAAGLWDTIETEKGWAFFNVNGYLGTATVDGEVIVEDDHVTD